MKDRKETQDLREPPPPGKTVGIFRVKAIGKYIARRMSASLSYKLLVLTIAFIMLAEVLIFAPSVSNFRENWLKERLAAAQIAALASDAAPDRQLSSPLQLELLRNAQVHAVALKRNNTRRLILQAEMPERIDGHYDLRSANAFTLLKDAIAVFFMPYERMIRVVGEPRFGAGDFIEIVVSETPLKKAMIGFALNILALSIIISVFTAALVFISLNMLLVRPISRLTGNMVHFSRHPEDPARIIEPSERSDEIGTAERELQTMQSELAGMLQQKSHLAALGLAVSKINHDLRNILSNAQLISDHLGSIENPTVQRLTPKLVKSLDRAIRLCGDTLQFGRSQEAAPERHRFALLPLVEEVGESLNLPEENAISWHVSISEDVQIEADRDQLFRIFANLLRNGRQAIVAARNQDANRPMDRLSISAGRRGSVVHIEISDSGPGIPEKAREHLFEAFRGSARKGGTGLGLAISSELVRAHGGTIELLDTSEGTTFCIHIPDAVIDLTKEKRRSA